MRRLAPEPVSDWRECSRCGWEHTREAPCLYETGLGDKVDGLAFRCRGELYMHGLKGVERGGVEAAKDLLRGLLERGPETLLPCGTCRAGEVFPVLFERGLCF